MRDPQRIDPIIQLVREIWHKYPDLRLGELLENCADLDKDLYYLEDKQLEDRLRISYGASDDGKAF